jgi:hypothetical protein
MPAVVKADKAPKIDKTFNLVANIIKPIKTANTCGQRCQMHILHAEYPSTYSKKNALLKIAIEPKVTIPTSR